MDNGAHGAGGGFQAILDAESGSRSWRVGWAPSRAEGDDWLIRNMILRSCTLVPFTDHITCLMVRVDPDKVVPLMDDAASRAYLAERR